MNPSESEHTLSEKWQQIKKELQKTWGRLTHEELEKAKGSLSAINHLVQEKYGHAKEEVTHRIDEIMTKHSSASSSKASSSVNSNPSSASKQNESANPPQS